MDDRRRDAELERRADALERLERLEQRPGWRERFKRVSGLPAAPLADDAPFTEGARVVRVPADVGMLRRFYGSEGT